MRPFQNTDLINRWEDGYLRGNLKNRNGIYTERKCSPSKVKNFYQLYYKNCVGEVRFVLYQFGCRIELKGGRKVAISFVDYKRVSLLSASLVKTAANLLQECPCGVNHNWFGRHLNIAYVSMLSLFRKFSIFNLFLNQMRITWKRRKGAVTLTATRTVTLL